MLICNKLSTVDVKFCGVCFEEDDGCTDSQFIMWEECVMCNTWMHKKCSITDHSLCLGCYSTQQHPDPSNVQSPSTENGAVQNSPSGAGGQQNSPSVASLSGAGARQNSPSGAGAQQNSPSGAGAQQNSPSVAGAKPNPNSEMKQPQKRRKRIRKELQDDLSMAYKPKLNKRKVMPPERL